MFEINTGPGLEATSFDKYVEAFEKVISDNKKEEAPKTTSGKTTKVGEPVSYKKTKEPAGNEREFMQMQLSRLQEMLKEVDDGDLETVKRLGAKLIFGSGSSSKQ